MSSRKFRRRYEGEFWTVPREWPGETVFVVASGPSVAEEDTEQLRGRKVIAINSSVYRVPFAQYLFFGDRRWWTVNYSRLRDFSGTMVTVARRVAEQSPNRPLKYVRKVIATEGVARSTDAVVMQRTSLSGGINLAVHLGAARIVLIGADMRPGENGETHHHAPHPWPSKPGCWSRQMADLRIAGDALKRLNVDVVNTSLRSKIDWWPKMSLRNVLEG